MLKSTKSLLEAKDEIIKAKDKEIEEKNKQINRLLDLLGENKVEVIPSDFVRDEEFKRKQAEGIQKAKDNGVKFGRPRIEKPENFDFYMKKLHRGRCTNKYVMEKTNLKPNVYYKFKAEWEEENGDSISK